MGHNELSINLDLEMHPQQHLEAALEIQPQQYLQAAFDKMRDDLPYLFEKFGRIKATDIHDELDLEKANTVLDALQRELTEELNIPVGTAQENGDRCIEVPMEYGMPGKTYTKTFGIHTEEDGNTNEKIGFLYCRYSGFSISKNTLKKTLPNQEQKEHSSKSDTKDIKPYTIEVGAEAKVVYCIFPLTNAQDRIEDTLNSAWKDLVKLDNTQVVWLFSLNGVKDSTFNIIDKFINAHPSMMARFLEMTGAEASKTKDPYARRTTSSNIAHNEALHIDRMLRGVQNRNSYLVTFDDDVTLDATSPKSTIGVLLDELDSNPNLMAVSPSIQAAEPKTGTYHPYFHYYSNIQKKFITQADPKPHTYSGCMARRLDHEHPVFPPAQNGVYEDAYLRYYYAQQAIVHGLDITDRYLYPVRTTTKAIFYHPEDKCIIEYIKRKRSAHATVSTTADSLFEADKREEIDEAMRYFLDIHRNSLNEALIREYGFYSKEFVGGKLFEYYLNAVAVSPDYTA